MGPANFPDHCGHALIVTGPANSHAAREQWAGLMKQPMLDEEEERPGGDD
jgi:hypothetical protein